MIVLSIMGEAMLRDFERVETPVTQETEERVHAMRLSVEASIDKEVYVNASVSIDGEEQMPASIKYRGNSSYTDFDKAQFRLVFKDETYQKDVKRNLFGMNSGSDWVLYGPFLDRSLIRSKFFLDLSHGLLPWSPEARYVEVYLNDAYEGLYLAIEAVQVDENRIALYEKGLLSGETAYLVWRERVGQEEHPITTYGFENAYTSYELSVHFPGSKRITQAQLDWISQDISNFERVLYSDAFLDEEKGYRSYINMDSFIDYFLINELAMLSDAGSLSTPMYKDLKGRLTMTVWDFNNALDNYYVEKKTDVFYLTEANYFEQMVKDPMFVSKTIDRYAQLRTTTWQDDALMEYIESLESLIAEAHVRNFERFGYTFEKQLLGLTMDAEVRDPSSYEEAIDQLKTTLIQRLDFLDNHLGDLYAFTQ